MGNALRKSSSGPIDGGSVRRVENLENGEILGYDESIVKKLICARRLAPFYKGAEEPQESDRSSTDQSDDFTDTRSLSASPPPNNSSASERRSKSGSGLFRRRKSKKEKDLAISPEVLNFLEERTSECPICFLYFPRNLNLTLCCNQSLCTSCFLNLRRPPSGRTISCPFCNQRDFSIIYKAPIVLLKEDGLSVAERERLFRPNPVKWESLRPYRPSPPTRQSRPSQAYRVATGNRAYYSGYSGRRMMNYGGGVLVLYDQNGAPAGYQQSPSSNRVQPQSRYTPAPPSTYYQDRVAGYSNYGYHSRYAYPGQPYYSYAYDESLRSASYSLPHRLLTNLLDASNNRKLDKASFI